MGFRTDVMVRVKIRKHWRKLLESIPLRFPVTGNNSV